MSRRRLMYNQGSELPSGYVRCKYLESNEKQHITTETKVCIGDYIFVSASSLSTKQYNTIFGTNAMSSVELYFDNHLPFVWTEKIRAEIKSSDGATGYGYVRNIVCVITGMHNDMNCVYQLFAYNASYKLCGRIYNFNIDGKINLVPCLDPSGRPCMYCTVTKKPFYNQGTGEFGYELMDGTYVAPV